MILAALVLSIVVAVVPTGFYVGVAWWLDRYEKEPWWLLGLTFLWGAVPAIILALIVEIVFDVPVRVLMTGTGAELIGTAVIAPVAEELFKAIPLAAIFWLYPREFDGLMDGLLYGALVGLGFALTENVFYFLGALAEGGVGDWAMVVVLRAVVFGLNHALFSSMFGLGLGIARYAGPSFGGLVRWGAPVAGLALGIFLHAVHNFFVSSGNALILVSLTSDWLGIVVWLLLVYVAGRQEARWIRKELVAEVQDGLLTAEQARAAGRYRSRIAARAAALQEHGVGHAHLLGRLYALAAELAFRKRQLQIEGNKYGTVRTITRLRDDIRELRQRLGE